MLLDKILSYLDVFCSQAIHARKQVHLSLVEANQTLAPFRQFFLVENEIRVQLKDLDDVARKVDVQENSPRRSGALPRRQVT